MLILLIVFVATGEEDTPRGPKKRITTFLVDRGTPGFTIRDGYRSVSHRGYKNMVLEFDDCRLPDAQVLGEVDGGFAVMNTWLYATRITVAAMSVGRGAPVLRLCTKLQCHPQAIWPAYWLNSKV
jgi:acyl-CoA dehydrogenase